MSKRKRPLQPSVRVSSAALMLLLGLPRSPNGKISKRLLLEQSRVKNYIAPDSG